MRSLNPLQAASDTVDGRVERGLVDASLLSREEITFRHTPVQQPARTCSLSVRGERLEPLAGSG